MKNAAAALLYGTLLSFVVSATAQQKLAHLDHEVEPDVPRASASLHETTPPRTYSSSAATLDATGLSRSAAQALFVHSDLKRAQTLSASALRKHTNDLEALFVHMEVAAAKSDTPAILSDALSLCEYGGPQSNDPRVQLALVRVREAAANTTAFRQQVPRIRNLVANARQPWLGLNQALLTAAMDGVPGLDPYALSRTSGILTDWRIVRALNRRALAGAEPDAVSRNDSLSQERMQGRLVENFQFPDGTVSLPNYLARRGTFYAAAHFATLEPALQILRVETGAPLEVYVDGALSLQLARKHAEPYQEVSLDLPPGPHRVLVRFDGAAAGFRLQVTPEMNLHFAPGTSSASTAEVAYLRGQLEGARNSIGYARANSNCSVVEQSVRAYREALQDALAAEAEQHLDGCAPESLAFAEMLSADGKHQQAAGALRKLLAAAPSNRGARLMLIRELQLAGDDGGAQQAAADWVRIAPNANSYRRMAASAEEEASVTAADEIPFYMPFRREVVLAADGVQAYADPTRLAGPSSLLTLLNDAVVIARPDGSVSLYVHRAIQATTSVDLEELRHQALPQGAQALTLRAIRADGSHAAWLPGSDLKPGDTLDVEYVVNYLGDGGIAGHPEAFQHIFGSPQSPSRERFVVLSPLAESDGAAVIVTGNPPQMTSSFSGHMLARMWESNSATGSIEGGEFAVVRVVEHENGWTTPRSAERRRKIETTHPGPRFLDAALAPTDSFGNPSASE